jgi:hypothetical protein
MFAVFAVFAMFTFPSWAIGMRKNRTTTSNSGTLLRACIRIPSCIVLPDAHFNLG